MLPSSRGSVGHLPAFGTSSLGSGVALCMSSVEEAHQIWQLDECWRLKDENFRHFPSAGVRPRGVARVPTNSRRTCMPTLPLSAVKHRLEGHFLSTSVSRIYRVQCCKRKDGHMCTPAVFILDSQFTDSMTEVPCHRSRRDHRCHRRHHVFLGGHLGVVLALSKATKTQRVQRCGHLIMTRAVFPSRTLCGPASHHLSSLLLTFARCVMRLEHSQVHVCGESAKCFSTLVVARKAHTTRDRTHLKCVDWAWSVAPRCFVITRTSTKGRPA